MYYLLNLKENGMYKAGDVPCSLAKLRAKFMAAVSIYDLVWVDESGCDKRNTVRKYGYRCDQRLLVRGVRYSAIPVMSTAGVHDVYLAEGSVDGHNFEHFVESCLLPVLRPFNGINPFNIISAHMRKNY